MAILPGPRTASCAKKVPFQAQSQSLSCFVDYRAPDLLLTDGYPAVLAKSPMDSLRRTIPHSDRSGHLLTLHNGNAWPDVQDCGSNSSTECALFAHHAPVLPAISTHHHLASLLLLLQVSSVTILNTLSPSSNGHRFIPSEYRSPIWVRVLPALENILYGANLSNILSAHKSIALDILAWLPYGIIHFGAPFVVSGILFLFGPPGSTPMFARAFGYMNLIGVGIQIFFPCAPPWYENLYGLAPANYSMPGSPAGLARIDELFGIDLYTSTFTASPMVFGAFPSLHSGSATIEALFLDHAFPKLRPLWIMYTLWLWWATMYLSHHYAVDLVGGSILAAVVFYYAKARFLPRIQADKTFRWDYDYTEVGDAEDEFSYGLMGMDHMRHGSDEWTVGSSSSVSSGSLSPIDDRGSSWESERIAAHVEVESTR